MMYDFAKRGKGKDSKQLAKLHFKMKTMITFKKNSKTKTCLVVAFVLLIACRENNAAQREIESLKLKRGDLISCAPAGDQFGAAGFKITGSDKDQEKFNLGLALLHSFEYDEAEKVFASIIDESPKCAMAYWGVAMSNYHPLWTPPLPDELHKGAAAVNIANALTNKNEKETAFINAIASFYGEADKIDHRSRSIRFEKAMEVVSKKYEADKEATILYALALTAAADPTDKTLAKQKKAGDILNALYKSDSQHPGIVHYIIHSYDSPELAAMALPAARKYASVAPASAHALHMPSHIFTRLGLWDEAIGSNLASVSSAQCYAKAAGITGNWDEEMHGLDYLVYAYLQKGDNTKASEWLSYVQKIGQVQPANFKVAYALAAIPCRYVLENHLWQDAAKVQVNQANILWKDFPWQRAMIHFTKLMGAAHTNQLQLAKTELGYLQSIHDSLLDAKDNYKASQVKVQVETGAAWILLKEGKPKEALLKMESAAKLEDKTEKHPVTPAELIPARELQGDMLMELKMPRQAMQAYTSNLNRHAARFNSLYGAAKAAEACGTFNEAEVYYQQLLKSAGANNLQRPELKTAQHFLDQRAALTTQ